GDRRLRLLRGEDRLLEGHVFSRRVAGPIVAVVADSDDRLGGIELAHSAAELVDEPRWGGDAPRLALLEVLVIGHEDLIVGGGGVAAIGPLRIVERSRDSDEPTVR